MHDDLKQRLHDEVDAELGTRPPGDLSEVLRRGRGKLLGIRLMATASVILVATAVVAGARLLTSDEALPPAEQGTNISPFVDTWTTTDVDGRTRTLVIRASGEDTYEITVQNHLALFCSGAPSTLTGTGQIYGSAVPKLVINSPEVTCDDGTEPKAEGFVLEEIFPDLTFEYDPAADVLTNFSPLESRRGRPNAGDVYHGLTLVWGRADGENRIGDVGGWVTYGNNSGIWARDLTSPSDPADRVQLSSKPGFPRAWSPDGSKLLVLRYVKDSDSGGMPETDLFVLNADGGETHLTRANGFVTGGSFSPDGSKVVYAVQGDRSSIAVVDVSGGTPDVLRTHDARSSTVCCLYGATFSPDGTQIAFFEGMGDHSNTLQVMNVDGSGSRTLIEQEFGHVRGLQWSPDGSQLVFASGGMWVIGADGTELMQLSPEESMSDEADPHWSPDGSHIAYREADEGGTLEIVRLDDLQVQNFGDGGSGLWTAELQW